MRFRFLLPVLALLLSLVISLPASAALCGADDVPAATLLLPYFEVDLERDQGMNTVLSINNADSAPVIANIVLWTDLGQPGFDFNIYLTGYDVVTLNLRELFLNGVVPQTGGGLVPPGDFSGENVEFKGCFFPLGNIPPILEDYLQNFFTGRPSALLGNSCGAINHGDNIARGFITVDVFERCGIRFPDEPGYFGEGGLAGDRNVLFGDYLYISRRDSLLHQNKMVAIESAPGEFGPGDATFYGAYLGGDGSDHREPLASTWGARLLDGGALNAETEMIVWRDNRRPIDNFPCGTVPTAELLAEDQVVLFDEDENPSVVDPMTSLFPYATNRRTVGGASVPVPFDLGWAYLNLNDATSAGVLPFKQAWVSTLVDATGNLSTGAPATALEDACAPASVILGPPAP